MTWFLHALAVGIVGFILGARFMEFYARVLNALLPKWLFGRAVVRDLGAGALGGAVLYGLILLFVWGASGL